MAIIDFVLILVIFGFVLFGFWFGLIHTLGALVGTVAGVFLASRWYEGAAVWAQHTFAGSLNVWKVIVFLLLFILFKINQQNRRRGFGAFGRSGGCRRGGFYIKQISIRFGTENFCRFTIKNLFFRRF